VADTLRAASSTKIYSTAGSCGKGLPDFYTSNDVACAEKKVQRDGVPSTHSAIIYCIHIGPGAACELQAFVIISSELYCRQVSAQWDHLCRFYFPKTSRFTVHGIPLYKVHCSHYVKHMHCVNS